MIKSSQVCIALLFVSVVLASACGTDRGSSSEAKVTKSWNSFTRTTAGKRKDTKFVVHSEAFSVKSADGSQMKEEGVESSEFIDESGRSYDICPTADSDFVVSQPQVYNEDGAWGEYNTVKGDEVGSKRSSCIFMNTLKRKK